MIMVIVQARVEREYWPALEAAYNSGKDDLTPGILQTFLTHSRGDPMLWQIITVWESLEALMASRRPGVVPRGTQIFNAAHAQETHDVLEVVSQAAK